MFYIAVGNIPADIVAGKELGVQLLVRSTRRFTLTEPGKYLYSHGKKLLGETEKLKNGTIAAAAGARRQTF